MLLVLVEKLRAHLLRVVGPRGHPHTVVVLQGVRKKEARAAAEDETPPDVCLSETLNYHRKENHARKSPRTGATAKEAPEGARVMHRRTRAPSKSSGGKRACSAGCGRVSYQGLLLDRSHLREVANL